MPYGFGQPQEDEVEQNYPVPAPTKRELAMSEEEHTAALIDMVRERGQDRPGYRDSATQVREVVFDDAVPADLINGSIEENLNFFVKKASRIPSLNRESQKKMMRSFADIEDAMGVDQYDCIVKTKLARKILEQEMSISRTDGKATSESGVSSITIQSTKSDYKVTNNSPPQVPDSIFAGLLGKK